MAQETNAVRVRTLFLSDLHLGTKGCQADAAAGIPHSLRCRHHLSRRRHRRRMAAEIGLVLAAGPQRRGAEAPAQGRARARASSTCRAITTSSCATIIGVNLGGIELRGPRHARGRGRQALSRDPRRPVRPGGAARPLARPPRRRRLFGGARSSTPISTSVRRRLGLTYWSLSAWAKLKVKNAVNFISRFEELLSAEAQRQGADGVICGHIHHADHA